MSEKPFSPIDLKEEAIKSAARDLGWGPQTAQIKIEALRAACMMSGTHPAGLTPATILSSAEQFRAWLSE